MAFRVLDLSEKFNIIFVTITARQSVYISVTTFRRHPIHI